MCIKNDLSAAVEQQTGSGAVVVQEYLDVSAAAVSRVGRPDRCTPSSLRLADTLFEPFSPLQTADFLSQYFSSMCELFPGRFFSPVGSVLDFSLLSFAGKRRLNFIILSQKLGVK